MTQSDTDSALSAASAAWEHAWARLDALDLARFGWTLPWLDGSMQDGNPIFSAVSIDLHRGVRLLHSPETTTPMVWLDTFDPEGPAPITELVIASDSSPAAVVWVVHLLQQWIGGAGVTMVPFCTEAAQLEAA